MKVLSWILTVLSLIALIAGIVFAAMFFRGIAYNNSPTVMYIYICIGCIVGCLISGFFGHLCITLEDEKGFPYYATFLSFWLIYGVIYIVKGVIHGSVNSGTSQHEERPVYIVNENGYERRLTLFEANKTDYEAPLGAGYGRTYSLFKDDTGRYWRSYDGNRTFIRE